MSTSSSSSSTSTSSPASSPPLAADVDAVDIDLVRAQLLSQLPDEPAVDAAATLRILVRLPDGSKLSRRFAASDRASALYAFVDTELVERANAASTSTTTTVSSDLTAAARAALDARVRRSLMRGVAPSHYVLVAHFPRASVERTTDASFADVGIASNTVLFVEQIDDDDDDEK